MRIRNSDHSNRARKPDREEATAIAVAALAHIAADPTQIERFVALTGIAPTQMRQASRSPGFFLAVLDYLGGHEPDLLAFAAAEGLDPARVAAAREALENG